MRKFSLLIFALSLFGLSFINGDEPAKSTNIPIIDLGKNSYPKFSGEYAELVKFIPLETTDEVIIDMRRQLLYFSDNRIVMLNNVKGDIFIFDGNGKIVSHFNHKGQGPEEYLNLSAAMAYDEANREIFIWDRVSNRRRCQVYSEKGKYLRSFYFPANKQYTHAYSFDNESLIAFDSNVETDSVYVLMSKKDGKILSCINIPLGKRISNYKTVTVEGRRAVQSGVRKQQLLKNGDDFILAEISADTIYKFTKNKQLIPLFARTPGVHKNEGDDAWLLFQPLKVTNNYVWGFKYIHDFQSTNNISIIYDVKKQQVFEDTDESIEYIGGYSVFDAAPDLPADIFVINSFPSQIMDGIEESKLKNLKIKELAGKLHEEDNPVLQVLKFR